ncbi:arsenate reductase ArsC [Massilia sp. 9096]|uniref:arsenate reductase ArsC n=1 Tax=Massilia sp. 9096 TaxID=1500894 RepID=UPI000562C38D|nr:arsenate reductase ArsC [Massilia sp. 9096]
MHILFLCTGNSCRSLIAEALFNHLVQTSAHRHWRALSAGSQPAGKLNERALALLAREGIATDGYFSKSWNALPVTPDVVITVCASAAGETCPAYLGPVLRGHWGVDDPSHVTGSETEIEHAFARAYAILHARIEAFLALPLDALAQERARLQAELERIGRIDPSGAAC